MVEKWVTYVEFICNVNMHGNHGRRRFQTLYASALALSLQLWSVPISLRLSLTNRWTVGISNTTLSGSVNDTTTIDSLQMLHSALARQRALREHPEIKEQIIVSFARGLHAKQIHRLILDEHEDFPITLHDVQNLHATFRLTMNRGLPAIQAMMEQLGEDFQYDYCLEEHNRVDRVLFFHNESLELLRRYSSCLVFDCTYKTNRFNTPFLNIVGITPTNESFMVGHAFMQSEEMGDYSWVIQWLRSFYERNNLLTPASITTDRAGAILSAINNTWPGVPSIVCEWHMNKAIMAYCQDLFGKEANDQLADARRLYKESQWLVFNREWRKVVDAKTEQEFDTARANLDTKYTARKPEIIDYLNKVWYPVKKRVFSAWTSRVRHYGNASSQRAESMHSAIKKELPTRKGHWNDVVFYLRIYLKDHNRRVKQSIEAGRHKGRLKHQRPLLMQVNGEISQWAIERVKQHAEQQGVSVSKGLRRDRTLKPCTDTFTQTLGLPCAHRVLQRLTAVDQFTVTDFDDQWRIDRRAALPPVELIHTLQDPARLVRGVRRQRRRETNRRGRSRFEHVAHEDDGAIQAQRRVERQRASQTTQQSTQPRRTQLDAFDIDDISDIISEVDMVEPSRRRVLPPSQQRVPTPPPQQRILIPPPPQSPLVHRPTKRRVIITTDSDELEGLPMTVPQQPAVRHRGRGPGRGRGRGT